MARSRPHLLVQERERQLSEVLEKVHQKVDALHEMFTGDPQRLDVAKLKQMEAKLRASAQRLTKVINESKA
jgi:hypothetical protein